MSTPFQRLRMVIDKVGVETFHTAHNQIDHMQQPQENDVYECHRYVVSHSRQKPKPVPSQKYQSPSEYYTKQDILKIRSLYEKQKQKSNQLRIQNQKLKHELQLRNENISELNRTFTQKNRQFQETKVKSSQADNQNYLRLINEKERMYKGEIQKLNEILDQLNKQLNGLRQKFKTYEGENNQKNSALGKEVQNLRGEIKDKDRQIRQLQNNVEQRKKLIEFNIQSHQQNLNKKQKQHQAKSSQLMNTINNLSKKIEQLNGNIDSHNNKYHQSKSTILNHQNSITQLKQTIDTQSLNHKRNIQQHEQKIGTLLKTLQHYQDVEKRNEELERLIEDEKAKEKYHIVEVKDQTIQLQVQMLRGQIKELLKSKAIVEEKLKKSCNCLRTTLIMKDQSTSLGETIKYMQGHQIKIIKQ